MLVVIDTNILVSALWSRNGAPAQILSMVISGQLIPCYDSWIMAEYTEVLRRPKFRFTSAEVDALLDWFSSCGQLIIANPFNIKFTDSAYKKFYETAKTCGVVLVTENIKHFPQDKIVMTVNDFLNVQ